MITYFSDPVNIYNVIIRLYCIGSISNSIEYFYLIDHFSNNGIFSWKVLKFNVKKPFDVLNYDAVFSQKGVFVILFSRLLLSVALFLFPVSPYTGGIILAIGLIASMFKIRTSIGNDGSDQMYAIVTTALVITFISSSAPVARLGLYLICAHSIISYVGAGVPKLMSKKWRSGTAVAEIMNTKTYGNEFVAAYLKKSSRWVNYFINWSVILFESLFFFAIILPAPWFYIFMILGVFFHLCNVIIMGLNNFFWAFVMTYPAIIYTNYVIWHALK